MQIHYLYIWSLYIDVCRLYYIQVETGKSITCVCMTTSICIILKGIDNGDNDNIKKLNWHFACIHIMYVYVYVCVCVCVCVHSIAIYLACISQANIPTALTNLCPDFACGAESIRLACIQQKTNFSLLLRPCWTLDWMTALHFLHGHRHELRITSPRDIPLAIWDLRARKIQVV